MYRRGVLCPLRPSAVHPRTPLNRAQTAGHACGPPLGRGCARRRAALSSFGNILFSGRSLRRKASQDAGLRGGGFGPHGSKSRIRYIIFSCCPIGPQPAEGAQATLRSCGPPPPQAAARRLLQSRLARAMPRREKGHEKGREAAGGATGVSRRRGAFFVLS